MDIVVCGKNLNNTDIDLFAIKVIDHFIIWIRTFRLAIKAP